MEAMIFKSKTFFVSSSSWACLYLVKRSKQREERERWEGERERGREHEKRRRRE